MNSSIKISRNMQAVLVAVVATMLLASCSLSSKRKVERYVPAVAANPQVPSPADVAPTNLDTIEPTVNQVVIDEPDIDTEALKFQVLKDERSVFFDYDSSAVKAEYNSLIQAIARAVSSSEVTSLRIEGNTDIRGSREYNLALAQRRANSVKKSLITVGVPSRIIRTISYGKEKSLAPGDDEESHAINRRSDILYQGEY